MTEHIKLCPGCIDLILNGTLSLDNALVLDAGEAYPRDPKQEAGF
jgi:hypothetical protein